MGLTCGAVTGGIMALSLALGPLIRPIRIAS